uniref:Uncharacterized protein n=1 Tax=viral metagenome TaxID=1070528 RepID=A0A6C0ES33_9ZZZZ
MICIQIYQFFTIQFNQKIDEYFDSLQNNEKQKMQKMFLGPDTNVWEIITFLILICIIFRFVYLLTQPFECCYRKIVAMNSNQNEVTTEIISINDLHNENHGVAETTATIINVPIINYENKNEIISSDLPIADIV